MSYMRDKNIFDLEKRWNDIEKIITRMKNILQGLPGEKPIDANDLFSFYSNVYNMCTYKDGNNIGYGIIFGDNIHDHLYDKYKKILEEYCKTNVLQCLGEKDDEPAVLLLMQFVKKWRDYKVFAAWLFQGFQYLDRYYIRRRSLPTLGEVAQDYFQKLACEEVNNLKVLNAHVLHSIKQDRDGETNVDSALLREFLDIFIELGSNSFYPDFEAAFLRESAVYYSRTATSTLAQQNILLDYVAQAEEFIEQEKLMLSRYLPNDTMQELAQIIHQEFFNNDDFIQIVEKKILVFQALLKEDKECDDLQRMYNVFSRIPDGLIRASKVFKEHVTFEVMTLVEARDAARKTKEAKKDASQDQVFIWNVVNLHDEYSTCINTLFANHILFRKASEQAFMLICNKIGGILEMLSTTLCDKLLRCNGEEFHDEAIQDSLKKAVTFLVCINDRDLFIEIYGKILLERLLEQSLDYHDSEIKSFIVKLKHQFGVNFTSQLEGKLKDLAICKESNTRFKEYIDSNPHVNPGADLSVTVLAAGSWATYKPSDLNLPAEMERCVKAYEEFYRGKNKSRKLTWIFSLGTCILSGIFGSKTVELVVTTYQASILLLFNSSDRLSFAEIMSQLNLKEDDLIELLNSLSGSKHKLLINKPDSERISHDDYFELNAKFTANSRQIEIHLPRVIENKKAIKGICSDRSYAIDAAIVRIIKRRKILSHQQLVAECVEELNYLFKPDTKAIKKRVEILIERDYMERDTDEFNILRYIA